METLKKLQEELIEAEQNRDHYTEEVHAIKDAIRQEERNIKESSDN